jgi:hypothetical protein
MQKDLIGSKDQPWDLVGSYNWSVIEVNVAIFVSCGPAFKAFIRRYFPRVFGSCNRRRSTGDGRQRPGDHTSKRRLYPLSRLTRSDGGLKTRTKQPEAESKGNTILPDRASCKNQALMWT